MLRLHIVCREVPKELKTGKLEPQRLVALLRDQTKDTTSYRDKLLGCITGALSKDMLQNQVFDDEDKIGFSSSSYPKNRNIESKPS